MKINARNLAAALTSLGADVESALLELSAVAPTLDAKVRAELFRHNKIPKLRYIQDRNTSELYFIDYSAPRWACVMHAVDQICRVIDDNSIVTYLNTKFSNYNIEVLIDPTI